MYDYDTSLAYMALGDAQRFFDLKDEVSALEIRVSDIYAARGVARALETSLGGSRTGPGTGWKPTGICSPR